MEFTQPTEEIVTDKTKAEQAKVDQLRNNATILDAEVTRLKGLIQSENYTIGQLGKEKADLENAIPELTDKVELLKTIKQALESDITTLQESKDQLAVDIQTQQEYIAKANIELKEKQEKLDQMVDSVEIQLSDINVKYQLLDSDRKVLDEKIAKLKEIIN